jgi:2,4'-dihydroxyacetophenone dioxygenase
VIEMPEAFHTATDELPYADDWADTPGIRLKLLMADIEGARFAVRITFAPGILLPPHKHTGEVHAFTLAGEWSYLEHPKNPRAAQARISSSPRAARIRSRLRTATRATRT